MSNQEQQELVGSHILVIEDEPTIRRFYERLFGPLGLETSFAPSGTVAMEMIESGRSYDVILLDVRLPGLSGREIWKLLQLKRPELCSRVIMVTGDILNEGTRQLLEDSGRPYLEKPFSTEDLLTTIKRVVLAPAPEEPNRDQRNAG